MTIQYLDIKRSQNEQANAENKSDKIIMKVPTSEPKGPTRPPLSPRAFNSPFSLLFINPTNQAVTSMQSPEARESSKQGVKIFLVSYTATNHM